jgi:hypothetical protein
VSVPPFGHHFLLSVCFEPIPVESARCVFIQ